ncbi:thioredoxin family protein [Marinifilum sp. RC60d5]|uniref:thioredoxin family protein n=1 Tax=Marinifilum sp. RC60d5 TaxID=3458414 RepID=UPI004035E21B
MKKILVLLVATFMCSGLFAQGIEFEHGTWAEAKAKAKVENKLIFVDVYTDWCGPCMRMAASVFKDSNVGEYMNSNFISMKIDAEKGEGVAFAKEYATKAFPTLLFINGDGKVVYKSVGGKNSEEFIALSKLANNPNKQLATLEDKYNSGNRNMETVLAYIAALKEARKNYAEIISSYLNELGDKNWTSETVYEIVSKYMDDCTNPTFIYFLKNRKAYQQFASQKDIDAAAFNVFKMNYINAVYGKINLPADSVIENAKKVDEPLRTHLANYFTVAKGGDFGKKEYRDIVDCHVTNYATAWEINGYINFMLYNKKPEDIPEELKMAEKWCLKGMNLENSTEWRTKYINILLKQGRKDEAIKLIKEELPKAQEEINNSSNRANTMATIATAFVQGEISKFPMAAQKGEEWIKEALKSIDSFTNNTVLVAALSANGKADELKQAISKLEKMAKNDMEKRYVESLKDYPSKMTKEK